MPKELILTGTGFFCIILSFLILIISDKIAVQLATMMLCGLCFFQLRLLYNAHQAAAKHDLLSSTLDTVVDMHWYWDLENGTFEYRGALPDLLGYPLSANPDSTFWSHVIHPVDRPLQKYQLLRHLEDESRPYHCEYRMRDHDGSYHWFLGRGKVVKRSKHGHAQLMVGSLEHIQERKELEQSLIHAHKMEAVGQLTGGIAHDFNNVLGSILGYTELSLESTSEPRLKIYLEQILQSGHRAKHLVSQLLDFSRKTSVKPEPVNLSQEIHQAADLLRATLPKWIDISEAYPDHACMGFLDANQLQRVLLNLCINARDAMPEEGKLAIKLETNIVGEFQCDSCQSSFKGPYHCLSITDNGEGIDKALIHQLFDPFFTTKAFGQGTGMGLAVVHGIVHEFEGHIQLTCEPGLGTKATVFIPYLEQKDNHLSIVPSDSNAA